MATPHTCPVCLGTGAVPPGGTVGGTYQVPWSQTCHACGGTGIVWEYTSTYPAVVDFALPAIPAEDPPQPTCSSCPFYDEGVCSTILVSTGKVVQVYSNKKCCWFHPEFKAWWEKHSAWMLGHPTTKETP